MSDVTFSYLFQNATISNKSQESPPFVGLGRAWKLLFERGSSYGYVELHHFGRAVLCNFTIRLQNQKTMNLNYLQGNSKFFNNDKISCGKDICTLEQSGLIINDSILVVCNLTVASSENIICRKDLAISNTASLLRKSYVAQSGTDFTVIVEDTKFQVHKIMLAVHSTALRAMLESPMQESVSDELVLDDFHPAVVKCFLDVLYCVPKACSGVDINIVMEVMRMADKYGAVCVTQGIENEIALAVFDVDNCVDVLVAADRLSYVGLKAQVMSFIKFNLQKVIDKHKMTMMDILDVNLRLEVFEALFQ